MEILFRELFIDGLQRARPMQLYGETKAAPLSATIEKPTGRRTEEAASGATDTLFAVATHKFDRAIYRNNDRIHRQLGRDYKFIVHYDATSTPDVELPRLDYPVLPFNFKEIRTKFPHLRQSKIVPGNKYPAYIELLTAFPEIQYFWFVEYDVRFSGNWRTLVDTCRRSDADMLGCHIRTRQEIPDWDWWPSIQNMHDPQRQLPGIRAFTWAVRLSRRAMDLIAQRCIEDGWTGHLEALLPSLLHDAGMRVEEIGGRSPFTPPERRGLFYSSEFGISSPSLNGDFGLGSNRFGPPLLFWGARRNRLYHPVKTDRRPMAVARDIVSLVRYKRDSALDLLRRLRPGSHH
jgi:hypothetical protein